MLDPKVFKAYDVRGIYPTELDEDGAYAIGRAYVEQFEPQRIAVGRDMRLSSPSMAAALIRGATEARRRRPRPRSRRHRDGLFRGRRARAGRRRRVTASHNPKEYTGMKIVRAGRACPSAATRACSTSATGPWPSGTRPGDSPSDRSRRTTSGRRMSSACCRSSTCRAIKPLRVVIDAANGMAGVMLPPVLERLPIEAVRHYFEPDGTFPNHEPNPLLPENREFIVEKTTTEGADFGVAFDGDADRCFFVDDTGEFVPGDFVTALLAESVLEKEPGRERSSTTCARAGRCRRRSSAPAACRSSTASATRSSSTACARRAPSSAARSRATTTSATSRQADSGVVPFLLMLELVSKRAARSSPRSCARTASATSSPAS